MKYSVIEAGHCILPFSRGVLLSALMLALAGCSVVPERFTREEVATRIRRDQDQIYKEQETLRDPVTFEVLKNAFVNIVDQMAEQIFRTCYSFVIYSRDFSSALCDPDGNTVELKGPPDADQTERVPGAVTPQA